jgi:hypothetical protein
MKKESLPLSNEILLRISKVEEKQDLYSQSIPELQESILELRKKFLELQVNFAPQSKTLQKKQTKETKRVNVNLQVLALLAKYSDKVWTSDELAKKIGCSGAAVRKTSTWNIYRQKQKVVAGQQCSIRKGFKDKNGNIDTAVEDN